MGQSGETAVVAAARAAVALQVDPLPMAAAAAVSPATAAASAAKTYTNATAQHHEPLLPTDTVIYFRKLVADDIDQVRALHETWFPIRYNQSFYDGAATGLWMETGGPLFTQLAVQVAPPRSLVPPPAHASGFMHPRHAMQSSLRPNREYILGAVTASTLPLTKIDDPDLIAADDTVHTHVMYILTLGSRLSVRRKGIASALLQACIDHACRQPQCGAVYLHVKADNVSALRFYEKNGFQNLRYLQDYYVIDGVRHDAYLYIRYVNGAGPQPGWLEMIARPLLAFFSLASSGWRKLVDGLASADDDAQSEHASKSVATRTKSTDPSPASYV